MRQAYYFGLLVIFCFIVRHVFWDLTVIFKSVKRGKGYMFICYYQTVLCEQIRYNYCKTNKKKKKPSKYFKLSHTPLFIV